MRQSLIANFKLLVTLRGKTENKSLITKKLIKLYNLNMTDEMMKNMSSRLNDLKTYYAILKDESC